MLVTIRYKYAKQCSARYSIFYNGKKLKNGKAYDLQEQGNFEIQENNIFLTPFWIIGLLINLVCGFFGSFDDYGGESSLQRIMSYQYNKPSQELIFELSDKTCKIIGVESFTQLKNVVFPNYKIQQRIKISRFIIILVPTLILIAITILIFVVLEKN